MVEYGKFKTLNSRKYIIVPLLIMITGCTSCSSLVGSDAKTAHLPDSNRIAQGDGLRLSEALKKNMRQAALSPSREKILKEISWASAHKKGKPHLSYEQCISQYSDDPECRFLKKDWAQEWVEEWAMQESEGVDDRVKISKRKRQKIIDKIAKNMKAGKVESFPDQRPGDIYLALKKFKTWDSGLSVLADKVIAEPTCYAPEFYNYLGLKAEEFFPAPELVKVSEKIYQKGDECGKDPKFTNSKYVQSTRFRLGLISVLDNNCKQAQEVFGKLAKANVSDYTTRALYWGAHCAKSESKDEQYLSNFNELFKTNPLGFHTLSMAKGASVLAENLGKPIDPIVQTRTELQPQFNSWISVIEDLDSLGEHEAVRKMFAPIKHSSDFLTNFEPGVRLYLSTFAYRANDRLSLFRILDSVFRTQSEYVVDSTLKLFYPMEHFDAIVANAKKVNPYLIAALIRQESAFQSNAKSHVGAMGLMQLMPATARLVDRKVKKNQLFNPEVNVRIGVKYFESLVDRFNGDVELALAAYNAGPIAVDQWLKRYPLKNKMLFLDLIPFSETRNYVTLIGRNYYWYSQLYSGLAGNGAEVAQKRQPAVFNALKAQEE